MIFLSKEISLFFGRKIKVLNFHDKKYLNPSANARYKKNRKILEKGKLANEFDKWMKRNFTYKMKIVILGLRDQKEFNEVVDICRKYKEILIYTYTKLKNLQLSEKTTNFHVIFVGEEKIYDSNVVVNGKFNLCPKFKFNRPCDTCLKCLEGCSIPKTVEEYIF